MSKSDSEVGKSSARHHPRSARLYAADMFTQGAEGQRIIVKDISARRCGARAEQTPPIGANVSLALHGVGPVRGTVVWIEKGRFGIRFDESIDVKAVMSGAMTTGDFRVAGMPKPSSVIKRPSFGRTPAQRGE